MSIRIQLGAAIGVLVFLIVLMAGGLLVLTSQLSSEGLHTNLSGRQRALSQRLTKESLMFSRIPSENNRKLLIVTLDVFERSLKGLLYGGAVPIGVYNTEVVVISPVLDEEALQYAEKQLILWIPFKQAVMNLLNSHGKDDDALLHIAKNELMIFSAANSMTNRLAKATEEKANRMIFGELLVLFLSVFAALFTLVISSRISSSILKLAEHSDLISLGRSTSPVPTDGPGEVGMLGKSLDRMRISLTKAMELLNS